MNETTGKPAPLTTKYHPRAFEDVYGQAEAKAWLSGVVKRDVAMHFILTGAYGSGKTSLVSTFARAMNCDQRLSNMSPCNQCESCLSENEYLIEYDTPSKSGTAEAVRQWLDRQYFSRKSLRWTIRFVDECHALEPAAVDLFLRRLEVSDQPVIYAFATTDASKLSAAFMSRLVKLSVYPLSQSESLKMLRDVCRIEAIKYSDEGLSLLAAIARGHPRSLLMMLDHVHEVSQRVDLGAVKQALGHTSSDYLVSYMLALAEGRIKDCRNALFEWIGPTEAKIKLIVSCLKEIYFSDILGQGETVVDPQTFALANERAQIVERFRVLLRLTTIQDLETSWLDMLAFWVEHNSQRTNERDLALILFEQLVAKIAGAPKPDLLKDQPQSPHKLAAVPVVLEDQFIEYGDVCKILDRASYQIQATGHSFDAIFVLRSQRQNLPEQASVAAIRNASLAIINKLGADLNTSGAIITYERSNGVEARLICVLQDGVESYDCREAIRAIEDEMAVLIEENILSSGETNDSMRAHWDATVSLCASYADGPTAISGENDILDRIRIKKADRRQSGPLRSQVVEYWGILSDELVAMQAENGLPPILTARQADYDHLRLGWELQEHQDRLQLERIRQNELAEIKGTLNSALQLSEFVERWRVKIAARQKSWEDRWKRKAVRARR